jgi:hypothetical protein
MTETVKKTTAKPKAPAKPRKTDAKANGPAAAPKAAGTPSNVTSIGPSQEQVAALAHKYWSERGHQHGYHEQDWFRAEQELRSKEPRSKELRSKAS